MELGKEYPKPVRSKDVAQYNEEPLFTIKFNGLFNN
jgi:hypothetical protein